MKERGQSLTQANYCSRIWKDGVLLGQLSQGHAECGSPGPIIHGRFPGRILNKDLYLHLLDTLLFTLLDIVTFTVRIDIA